MDITSANIKNFRNDLKNSVKELERKYGIAISLGNISYNESEFSGKLTIKNSSGNKKKDLKKEFELYCFKFGLKKHDYLRTVTLMNKKYIIIGVHPKARKNGIIIEDLETGKSYVTSKADILPEEGYLTLKTF